MVKIFWLQNAFSTAASVVYGYIFCLQIPSAPIYQSHGTPARSPYFQAAWNAWMRQSVSSLPSQVISPRPAVEDVEPICRLFGATNVAAAASVVGPRVHQQCEQEVLVGGTLTNLYYFYYILASRQSCRNALDG